MKNRNNDEAHRFTDKTIVDLDVLEVAILKAAERKVSRLLKTYLAKYETELKSRQNALERGELTQEAFDLWCNTTIYSGEWHNVLDMAAYEYTKANEKIAELLNAGTAKVFAENYNYALWQVARGIDGN